MAKKKDNRLSETYEAFTCLEKNYQDMRLKELEQLSADAYNTIVIGLNPKRVVLLNELLDVETEIRFRNQTKA